MMSAPKKIYDAVSRDIIVNGYNIFKAEAMKFPPNHRQRSFLKRTAAAMGVNERTISRLSQAIKSSTGELLHCISGPRASHNAITTANHPEWERKIRCC